MKFTHHSWEKIDNHRRHGYDFECARGSKVTNFHENFRLRPGGDAMNRPLNLILGLIVFALFSPFMLAIAVVIKLTSRGPVFFLTDRVGTNNIIFKMYKFRTMRTDAPPNVATHLMTNPEAYVTGIGKFLRKTSLDEVPQLINIIKGDMNFVGPRPALYNQDDLIALRTQKGIHKLGMGLTGWAQINGRDDLSIPVKVEFDEYYLHHRSLWLDLKIIFFTFVSVTRAEGVSH
jgi:O-antigen biosynthesis protein WbqP